MRISPRFLCPIGPGLPHLVAVLGEEADGLVCLGHLVPVEHVQRALRVEVAVRQVHPARLVRQLPRARRVAYEFNSRRGEFNSRRGDSGC
eukprot:9159864-Pyramimonas_sp.AAC.1